MCFLLARSGFFTNRSGLLWADRRWGHPDDALGGATPVGSCRGLCAVPGPLQSLQRAEFWGLILALQAAGGVHLGVDNLGVVRHVGRLLNGKVGSRPAELVEDGIESCLSIRCSECGVWESPTKQKNSSTPCWAWILGVQSRPRVWKRLRVEDHSSRNHADAKVRRVYQDDDAYVPGGG